MFEVGACYLASTWSVGCADDHKSQRQRTLLLACPDICVEQVSDNQGPSLLIESETRRRSCSLA